MYVYDIITYTLIYIHIFMNKEEEDIGNDTPLLMKRYKEPVTYHQVYPVQLMHGEICYVLNTNHYLHEFYHTWNIQAFILIDDEVQLYLTLINHYL